jgi:hypothetical protein
METETKPRDNIESLFEKTGDYIETRLELYKLRAVETSSDIIGSLISKLIVSFAVLIFLFLANIGIALWLGKLMGNAYLGFFTLAGIYLFAALIIYKMRRKWLKDPLVDKLIEKMLR